MVEVRTQTAQDRAAGAGHRRSADNPRDWLLACMPVSEQRLELAGISTAVLIGGDGPPIVFLHGPGEHAVKWFQVVPDLATGHRVIAPDLPGHGTSEVPGGRLDSSRVLQWLDELIDVTCSTSPVLVAQILGGAIAARFAASRGDRVGRLVLVDTLGLAPFQPAPEFGRALAAFIGDPTEDTHDDLWHKCAFDLDRMRTRMGEKWDRLKAYNLDRARTPSLRATQQSLMEQFGMPAVPEAELARIAVPTALIWGRHDLATPLRIAEAASSRYGWPLHVIENARDDPPMEQPEAFLAALRDTLVSAWPMQQGGKR